MQMQTQMHGTGRRTGVVFAVHAVTPNRDTASGYSDANAIPVMPPMLHPITA